MNSAIITLVVIALVSFLFILLRKKHLAYKTIHIVSQVLRASFLFFPAILFILLAIFCFWSLGQGKDLVVAFIDNTSSGNSVHLAPALFLVITGFWVYVSWYSSRIISYIKKKQEKQKLKEAAHITDGEAEDAYDVGNPFFYISKPYLEIFPRVIGNICFLILELSVLQLPILSYQVSLQTAWIAFVIALPGLYFLNEVIVRKLNETQDISDKQKVFDTGFYIFVSALLVYTLVLCFIPHINVITFLGELILFHCVFIWYINLRRIDMDGKAAQAKMQVISEQANIDKRTWLEATMDFFCIPRREKGYYQWFLFISVAGILIYTITVLSLPFSRFVGPFPVVILAFAVLLLFGNVVTAFSVRYQSNFHVILFAIAFLIGFHETHYVKTRSLPDDNGYSSRPNLKTYLSAWLNSHHVSPDSNGNGYDVYFVMANGGASRSGYWTSSVLGTLEDASMQFPDTGAGKRFSDHIFCLSGTSGGGVGVATFFGLLHNRQNDSLPEYANSAKAFLKQDYFSYTFARMLGPDCFNYLLPFVARKDRARALEESFEISSQNKLDTALYHVPFNDSFSHFRALLPGDTVAVLPILCINTTRMDDGNPGVVTNLNLNEDSILFNHRVDVLHLLKKNEDISLASAAILGARFPYISPAGRIADDYFVDGGYFDNSGAGVVQEIIRGIINIGKDDSMKNGTHSALFGQIKKLRFHVLHITNSPVILDSSKIVNAVAPIKNDLLAPVMTIVGAYDMQTTVNDARLTNFIHDINAYTGNRADYIQIPLYEDTAEWKRDIRNKKFRSEPAYAMNWFMSDTTRHRIDARLQHNPRLDMVIERMKKQKQ